MGIKEPTSDTTNTEAQRIGPDRFLGSQHMFIFSEN